MEFVPEISASSIVVLGEFSPITFHPHWLAERGLIGEQDANDAIGEMRTQDFSSFTASWLQVTVERQRIQVQALEEPFVRIFDLCLGILEIFPEQPVMSLGINRECHIRLSSAESAHQLGDRLAPKEPWGNAAKKPNGARWAGLKSITIEWPREESPGSFHMTVQPSTAIPIVGVYFGSNDHYIIGEGELPSTASAAANVLKERWEQSMAFSDQIRDQLLGGLK